MIRTLIALALAALILGVALVVTEPEAPRPKSKATYQIERTSPLPRVAAVRTELGNDSLPKEVPAKSVQLDVPFTAQAPIGNWHEAIYQDGCEEAAILMANRWLRGEPLSSTEALQEIKSLSDFGRDNYGVYIDVSAEDAVRLFKEYYEHQAVWLSSEVTVTSIREQLQQGRLVIIPANGRALPGNRYTPPGPDRHMLVITGYDVATREFITNDPGTKFGRNFRFPAEAVVAAVRDYPSGVEAPITEELKVMIVVAAEA